MYALYIRVFLEVRKRCRSEIFRQGYTKNMSSSIDQASISVNKTNGEVYKMRYYLSALSLNLRRSRAETESKPFKPFGDSHPKCIYKTSSMGSVNAGPVQETKKQDNLSKEQQLLKARRNCQSELQLQPQILRFRSGSRRHPPGREDKETSPNSNKKSRKQRFLSVSPSLAGESKAARQLGVIMIAFTVCFCPYFVVFMLPENSVGKQVLDITTWLGYLNSTLNPFLYPLCNLIFRRKFKSMLGKGRLHDSR
ncbi:Histamine H1 receptor [Cichlidogyrus casuarinus]|uniref:Histamine H1 receptor n=1 Tax=Cichlidogyrus casuarinus TaxID=1844966 RepID=A0ABD2PXW6_9PLAT